MVSILPHMRLQCMPYDLARSQLLKRTQGRQDFLSANKGGVLCDPGTFQNQAAAGLFGGTYTMELFCST